MTRKAPTLTEKLAAVLPRIRCSWCGKRLSEPIQWDHTDFVALGGTNASLDPMHAACHREKTNGIPHIPLSGDVSKIAKVKRLSKKHQAFRENLLRKDADKQEQAEFRSKWQSGRKLSSRGFSTKAKSRRK